MDTDTKERVEELMSYCSMNKINVDWLLAYLMLTQLKEFRKANKDKL